MTVFIADPRIDTYVGALPAWQQQICRHLREVIHAVDADMVETTKRAGRPYFVLAGNVCALLAATGHVNLVLYDGGLVADPHRIVTRGHENATARLVAVREAEPINAAALTEMLAQIIANNRAGGWRALTRAGAGEGGLAAIAGR